MLSLKFGDHDTIIKLKPPKAKQSIKVSSVYKFKTLN